MADSVTSGLASMQIAREDQKREEYLDWNEYFMAVSFLSAMRSKDPATQVGACIVNTEKKIVGTGYNGMPNLPNNDESLPWGKTSESALEKKYLYVVHAEMNAIVNKNSESVVGCTIYVSLFPCNECAKLIIQSGIKNVIYLSDKDKDEDRTIASKKMLDMAGVNYTKFIPKKNKIVIDFGSVDPTDGRVDVKGKD